MNNGDFNADFFFFCNLQIFEKSHQTLFYLNILNIKKAFSAIIPGLFVFLNLHSVLKIGKSIFAMFFLPWKTTFNTAQIQLLILEALELSSARFFKSVKRCLSSLKDQLNSNSSVISFFFGKTFQAPAARRNRDSRGVVGLLLVTTSPNILKRKNCVTLNLVQLMSVKRTLRRKITNHRECYWVFFSSAKKKLSTAKKSSVRSAPGTLATSAEKLSCRSGRGDPALEDSSFGMSLRHPQERKTSHTGANSQFILLWPLWPACTPGTAGSRWRILWRSVTFDANIVSMVLKKRGCFATFSWIRHFWGRKQKLICSLYLLNYDMLHLLIRI